MAGRTRTTKKLAQRINLDYFKTLHGIPRWRRILSGAFVIVGLAWLGWHAVAGSPKPYNAGPLAHSHRFARTELRRVPCLAGELSKKRHRSGVPGMPRWPHPSRGSDVHAILLELPRGASRHAAAGKHHRSRLHAMPCRFEDHARGVEVRLEHSRIRSAAIPSSRRCGRARRIQGPSSSTTRCI